MNILSFWFFYDLLKKKKKKTLIMKIILITKSLIKNKPKTDLQVSFTLAISPSSALETTKATFFLQIEID